MSWSYCQKTGDLCLNGQFVARGYSGHEEGRNNPDLQALPRLGPIPRGLWTISGPPTDTVEHGPFVLRLEPAAITETFGRSGFLIHGDSALHPGAASEGCICMPREVREMIWANGDRDLVVVAEPTEDDTEILV